MELAAICLLVMLGVGAIVYAGTSQQKRRKPDNAATGDAGAPIPSGHERNDDLPGDIGGMDGGAGSDGGGGGD